MLVFCPLLKVLLFGSLPGSKRDRKVDPSMDLKRDRKRIPKSVFETQTWKLEITRNWNPETETRKLNSNSIAELEVELELELKLVRQA